MDLQQLITNDLLASGLTPKDIGARPIDMTERAACGIPAAVEGYVVPYYNIYGKPIAFYRTKLFKHDIKYKQLKNTSNHVYFPPNFLAVYNKVKPRFIILTEGEKKAAASTKAGYPAVAFGGVDSWRNRMLLLPKDTEFSPYSYNKALVGAKLPSSGWDMEGVVADNVAQGFEELANFMRDNNLHAMIIYDTDGTKGAPIKHEVNRAAAELGFELRRRGLPINRIRMGILPPMEGLDKTGLDDILQFPGGEEIFKATMRDVMRKRSAFPIHPNLEQDLNKKLQNAKLTRKDVQRLSLSLITDLDARGIRMYSPNEDSLYYFEEKTAKLTKVALPNSEKTALTPWGKLLYQFYGLSTTSDQRIVRWLMTQFAGEDPVEDVYPHRMFAHPEEFEGICYQLGDSHYVRVTGNPDKPIEILHNGSDNILFVSEQSAVIDPEELKAEFAKRQEENLEMWWEDVLHEVRLKSHGKTATLFALLYYISPWLHRWRGTQLPAELVIGEAGSGKSTLCELRLEILSGDPSLRNAPTDLKDWYSSVTNTGGLHVIDNVQLLDKTFRQRLSDELCRLITEPKPHIELRKLYTEAQLMRIPVSSVFAFTSLTQPFPQNDLLQRSVILELDKMASEASTQHKDGKISYDSDWKRTQIAKFGGRTAWVSHHLYVLHKFFELANKKWKNSYHAKHRLINLEQSLMLMAELFGVDAEWIPDFLVGQADESIVDADWSLEGLKAFADAVRAMSDFELKDMASKMGGDIKLATNRIFDSRVMSNWFAQREDFMECQNLVNARKLGRYLQTHKALIKQVAHIIEHAQKVNNRAMYVVNK